MIKMKSPKVQHKIYGEGKIINIEFISEKDTRLCIKWENNKDIIGGWYNYDDKNLEYE